MKPDINAYLESYKNSLPDGSDLPIGNIEAFYFCADEENANICADLVLQGEIRATAGLLLSYEAEKDPIPEIGQLFVITNWDGEPQCIIETTAVQVKPFNEVTAEFAFEEGEGDKSLEFWRRAHWDFFSRECEEIGKKPSENMPVVLENFKVIWEETND